MMPGKGRPSLKGKGNGGTGRPVGRPPKCQDPAIRVVKEVPNSPRPPSPENVAVPTLKVIDHTKVLPRYTSVLLRSESDGIGMEDLDTLQLELETLLSSVALRRRQLQVEVEVINSGDDKDTKKLKAVFKQQPPSPGKRSRSQETGKPSKKLKESVGKSSSPLPVTGKPIKGKQEPMVPGADPEAPEVMPEMHRSIALKNDIPNKFWSLVEPFCTNVKPTDIEFLDELILGHENDSEYQRIPSLGKHYTLRWAEEDIHEEQKEGAKVGQRKGGRPANSLPGPSSTGPSEEIKNLIKKVSDRNVTPFGPLTQRLVSALIDERIMVSVEDAMEVLSDDKEIGNASPKKSGTPGKSVALGNPLTLERRIRKELEEQGIFDADEPPPNQEQANDEILQEMKRCQAELKAISSHNLLQLNRLRKSAVEQMKREEMKQRLNDAEEEVMEAYRRIASCRQKKKAPTKKEIELAWKALKEREDLILQLHGAS